MVILLLLVALLATPLLACTGSVCDEYLTRVRLPPGFHIDYYVPHVSGARSLYLSPANILYIGTRTTGGSVYAAIDRDGDNVAEEVITLATGLNQPNGISFRDGNLWVVEMTRIIRFDNIDNILISSGTVPEPVVVRTDLLRQGNHGWRYSAFSPDPTDPYLYIALGADCNICEVDGTEATISKIDTRNAATSPFEVVAYGVRNSVGFTWHPVTGDFFFTENGRDNWGNDVPGDELNRVTTEGLHYGFPYCYEKDLVDDEYNNAGNCNAYVPATQVLGPHVAALGNVFYTGENFPQSDYFLNLFIAEHGSWNRDIPIGYRVTLVKMNAAGTGPIETGAYTVFADGWLPDGAVVGSQAWGRPVDIKQLKDGSLILSDDKNNCVYRIYYTGTTDEIEGGNEDEDDHDDEDIRVHSNLRLFLVIGGSILIGLGVIFIAVGAFLLRNRFGKRCTNCTCRHQQNGKQQSFDVDGGGVCVVIAPKTAPQKAQNEPVDEMKVMLIQEEAN